MYRLGLACVLAIALPRMGVADEPSPTPAPTEPSPTPAPTEPSPTPAPAPAPAPAPVPPPTEVQAPPPRAVAPRRDIVIEVPGERSRNNKLILAGVAGAGLIASALGLYWHLDSRDASDEVSADRFTGKAWSEVQQGLVDRADRSKMRATVAYTIGGACLVGAIVAYIVTEPDTERAVIHTGGVALTPTEHGGGMVSRMWSF